MRRIFTDTMLFDVPILAMGPSGNRWWTWTACCFAPPLVVWDSAVERSLAEVVTARLSPRTLWFFRCAESKRPDCRSLLLNVDLPRNNGYKPREADNRVGYFMTSYRDLGDYNQNQMEAIHPPLESPKGLT